jgi:hypothetical protein
MYFVTLLCIMNHLRIEWFVLLFLSMVDIDILWTVNCNFFLWTSFSVGWEYPTFKSWLRHWALVLSWSPGNAHGRLSRTEHTRRVCMPWSIWRMTASTVSYGRSELVPRCRGPMPPKAGAFAFTGERWGAATVCGASTAPAPARAQPPRHPPMSPLLHPNRRCARFNGWDRRVTWTHSPVSILAKFRMLRDKDFLCPLSICCNQHDEI